MPAEELVRKIAEAIASAYPNPKLIQEDYDGACRVLDVIIKDRTIAEAVAALIADTA